MRTLKRIVPWWGKIAAKLLLSRIPFDYRVWRRFNVFVHGAMHRPDYAWKVISAHQERTGLERLDDLTVLEVGPGDSLATALIARTLGAAQVVLVDSGRFARDDLAAFEQLASFLEEAGVEPPDLTGVNAVSDVLQVCHAEYLTDGLDSLRAIPSSSVDLIFSQAVMEHIGRQDVRPTVDEFRRILKTNGVMSHQIDLKDHLSGGLNNLRFDERTWESSLFRSGGFYTNRVRFSQFVRIFEDAGFDCQTSGVVRWDRLPTPRKSLDAEFAKLPENDLLVSQFDIVCRPH